MRVFTLLSAAMALIAAGVLGRTVLKGQRVPFVMELPPYRMPTPGHVLLRMWERSRLFLTEAGGADPVFSSLQQEFRAQMGHEDCVSALPEGATCLAYSHRNAHQAYRLEQAPVYCTQFHPELTREDLHLRVEAYPQYIERISGMTTDEFTATLSDTPEAAGLLQRFVETVVAG